MPQKETIGSRAAIYARVSTEEQREGQTIDSQVAELERFAQEKEWSVVGIYKDEGWSGSILARPELDHLRDDASKGAFDLVLLNDVDRLARDVSHLGIVKRDLERLGIQVIFKKLPAEKSPTYNLMVNILGSFAEFERELISDRTRRGRRHKVEVRKLYLGGNAVYGLRYFPKDRAIGKEGYLEVVPEEAAVVKQMFDWVDREGLSARRVLDRLNEMKVPPKKGGARWGKSSVLRILRCQTYTGLWHYNKYEGCEPTHSAKPARYRRSLKCSVRLRDRSEWIPVALPEHLRIIDKEQWERVQRQLSQNITFSPRNEKHQYLLKGLVQCGGCNARYVGDPNHGKYYYRCYARCKIYPAIREEYLNEAIWEAVKEAILNPQVILEQVIGLFRERAKNLNKIDSEQSEADQALADIEAEEERIIEVYRKGIITPEQLGQEMEKLKERKEAVETRKSGLAKQASVLELPVIERSLRDYCKVAAQHLHQLRFEGQQRFLRLLLNNVVFEGNQVKIQGVIPVKVTTNLRETNEKTPEEQEDSVSSRIATTTAHRRVFSPYRTEEVKAYHRTHNPFFSEHRIETTMVYRNARNSVASGPGFFKDLMRYYDPPKSDNEYIEAPFEVIKSMPPAHIPLHQRMDRAFLQHLVREQPRTLKELCSRIEQELGIRLSTTAMCRLLKRYNVSHRTKPLSLDQPLAA